MMNHVLIGGQSLGMGGYGSPVLSSAPLPNQFMFAGQRLNGGAWYAGERLEDGFGNLFERLGELDALDNAGETIATAFGWYVQQNGTVSGAPHQCLVSNWARGSSAYAVLAKGTAPYTRGVGHVREARRRLGNRHVVRAVLIVHGESDQLSATYQTDIRQWQVDLETDYLGITGQTGRLPCFHSQISSWSCVGSGSVTTCLSPYLVYAEHKLNPTKTTLVCPKYFLPHRPADGVHLTPASYRWLGGYYGKAYVQQVVNGTQWEPVRPSVVTRTANVIDVTFTGVVGALALDTTRVSNPGNFGFEYTDDAAPPAIAAVQITGVNTVRVTLASTPAGANKKLRYAYTGVAGNNGGPTTGPRGCLRDSDPARGIGGEELFNWCVHFEEAAT